ncbi:Twin-arginine translocation protein TatC [hydrothermal vent metagenome]|uniref:Twin-arginine translocation protein TatC n=1 Tax=hydrothermal vent metagenome TaxID=652676 RepID=A0A3B0WR13_9ZZZZ
MAEKNNKQTSDEQTPGAQQKEQSLMDHLVELRDRLLHMVLAILIVFISLFAFSEDIFSIAAEPLLNLMPEGTSMIATGVTSPFLVPFKLVLLLSVLFTIPYLLHQMWAFIAPGLYRHEKRMATPILISSVLLFYCGIAFAYFVIFPILFGFFIGIAPEGVAVMTDIGQYLDFIIAIFLAFGIAFEVPVATFLLIAAGVTSADKLANKRPFIIIGAFVIGMLLTPPDVISQSLLAIPIWLLFELGLLASRIFLKEKIADSEEENVIMENEDFTLIEETAVAKSGDIPPDDHDEEGNPLNDETLDDDEMEKLFDEAESEEEENNREDDDASDNESKENISEENKPDKK